MQYGMTKPFRSTVAQCFSRISQMVNLMNYFSPYIKIWNLSIDTHDVGHIMMNRNIKFKLLPNKFQNTIGEDTNEDQNNLAYTKFVSLVKQCQTKDDCEGAKMKEACQKLKNQSNKHKDDGGKSLDRSSKSKNQESTNTAKKANFSKDAKGEAKYCALCNASGCPVCLYHNHNTEGCWLLTLYIVYVLQLDKIHLHKSIQEFWQFVRANSSKITL